MKHLPLLAVALCAFTFLAGRSAPEAVALPFPLGSSGQWPPAPQDMVSITRDWQHAGGPTSLAPGEQVLLFNVPANKYLVVTGFGLLGDQGWINGFASGAVGHEGLTPLRSLDNSSVDLVPGMNSAFAQGPLGLACRPSSRIILENLDDAVSHHLYTATLRGYLVDVQ